MLLLQEWSLVLPKDDQWSVLLLEEWSLVLSKDDQWSALLLQEWSLVLPKDDQCLVFLLVEWSLVLPKVDQWSVFLPAPCPRGVVLAECLWLDPCGPVGRGAVVHLVIPVHLFPLVSPRPE